MLQWGGGTPGLGVVSGPGISCTTSTTTPSQPGASWGDTVAVIYWTSASFLQIHAGWPSQATGRCAPPPPRHVVAVGAIEGKPSLTNV